MFQYRRPEPQRFSKRTSPSRHPLPCRAGVVLFLCIILAGCTLPTVDIANRQVIPAANVRKAAEGILSNLPEERSRVVKILDSGYFAYTRAELVGCLESCSWIADFEYKQDLHDCEEYAIETMAWVRALLPGVAFGFAIRETTVNHAENVFIDNNLMVWIVDIKRHGSELVPASGAFYFLVMI